MATTDNKEFDNTKDVSSHDHVAGVNGQNTTQRSGFNYGGNPLAHANTGDSARLPAFGGEFQPGLYRPELRKFANPAPLGLSAFALTTFVLSLINVQTRNVSEPNIVVAIALGYGGLVQLLAGMWEMAAGNTFGATAFSSYGGFWIAFGFILTPGGFQIQAAYATKSATGAATGALPDDFTNAFGFFLAGWFIFTTILLLCTLRSTVAFFFLFFTLDMAFLFLSIGYLKADAGAPNAKLIKTGGVFGLLAAFLAWYNALAGMADDSNSFMVLPVVHFPWSAKGREQRTKTERETV